MKPSDIYSMTPVSSNKDVFVLMNDWHLHVTELEGMQLDIEKSYKQSRVDIHILFDPYIDGERCCTIGFACLDGSPVMIFRHAGRGGHDLCDEFVTDEPRYKELVEYLRGLCESPNVVKPCVVDPSADLSVLNEFYGRQFVITDY